MAILLEKKDPPHPEAGRSLSKTPSNTKTERGILEKLPYPPNDKLNGPAIPPQRP